MKRRNLLQRCGAGLLATGALGLAGCSDSTDSDEQGGNGNGEQGENGGDKRTTTTAGDGMGTAVSTVDGLDVTVTETWTTASSFRILVTIQNSGTETTDVQNYGYGLLFFDDEETDITGRQPTRGSREETEIGPGSAVEMTVHAPVNGDPADVARYEFTLSCEGAFISGVYCEA